MGGVNPILGQTKTREQAPSLRSVLDRLGWRYERRARVEGGGLRVWDADGTELGAMWAADVWFVLKARGLVDGDGRLL